MNYLDIVIPSDLEVKWTAEWDVLLLPTLKIKLFEEAVVGDHGISIDSINEWFGQ